MVLCILFFFRIQIDTIEKDYNTYSSDDQASDCRMNNIVNLNYILFGVSQMASLWKLNLSGSYENKKPSGYSWRKI